MEQVRLKDMLENNIMKVTFVKAGGETRVMVCTLMEEHLPVGTKSTSVPNDERLTVWDCEIKEWRCFRYDSITDVEFF